MFSSASLAVAAPPVANTIAQRVLACTGCHGAQGRAASDGYFPRIAGKPAGCLYNFAPATVGSPRPFGMPPIATELRDEPLAQVLTRICGSWGNRAAAVSALAVSRYRSVC